MLSLSAIGPCHTQEDQSAWSLSGSHALAIIWKMAAEFLSLVGCGGYFMKPAKELGR